MSGNELMAVIGFFVLIGSTIAGVWWRVEGRIDKAKAEAKEVASAASATASMAREELAAHKLHVSETYISKQGHRESTDQILEAINRVNDRLDRAFEPKRRAGG